MFALTVPTTILMMQDGLPSRYVESQTVLPSGLQLQAARRNGRALRLP